MTIQAACGFQHLDEKPAKPKKSDFCPAFGNVAKRYLGFKKRYP